MGKARAAAVACAVPEAAGLHSFGQQQAPPRLLLSVAVALVAVVSVGISPETPFS